MMFVLYGGGGGGVKLMTKKHYELLISWSGDSMALHE